MRIRGSIWSTLTIALALVAVMAIASPALGGPSLKSLVKKEVTKQIAGHTGPQGSAGAAGANGINGTNGAQGPGAVRLTFSQPDTDVQSRTIGTVNGLTLKGFCYESPRTSFDLDVESNVGGAIHGINNITNQDAPLTPQIIAMGLLTLPNTNGLFSLAPNADAQFKRAFLDATYTNSNGETSLQLYAVANDGSGTCELHGTAVPAI